MPDMGARGENALPKASVHVAQTLGDIGSGRGGQSVSPSRTGDNQWSRGDSISKSIVAPHSRCGHGCVGQYQDAQERGGEAVDYGASPVERGVSACICAGTERG